LDLFVYLAKTFLYILYITMAYVSPFTFENVSRAGNDSAYLDQTAIQNTESCNYLLQNYLIQDCTMKETRALATSQPSVFYKGGHGAVGGCNIDDSSQLLIGSEQTISKSRTDMFQRPYATVPFLGRGSVCSVLEAQLKQGELSTNKRTITNLTEVNYSQYTSTPLIASVQQSIDTHGQILPNNEIRGGMTTRDMSRDKQ
jgi:hypothetical protein